MGITGNTNVEKIYQRKLRRNETITWRDDLWRSLYAPASSTAGLASASIVAVLILTASVVSALRSSATSSEAAVALLVVDSFASTVFLVEVLLRCVSSPSVRWLATDALLWLDVLLLLPAIWRVAAHPSPPAPLYIVCALEALGPLRLFKMARFLHFAQLLQEALTKSLAGLIPLLFFFLLVCLTCGSLVYAGDVPHDVYPHGGGGSDADDLDDDIPDIFDSWLAMATLSTVGWVPTNFNPRSISARLAVVLASMLGLPVIALALAVVGESFGEVWRLRRVKMVRLGLQRLLMHNGLAPNDVFAAFSHMDSNSSGIISFVEFKELLTGKLQLKIKPRDFFEVWRALDMNQNGAVTFDEFASAIFPELAADILETQPRHTLRQQRVSTAAGQAAGRALALTKAIKGTSRRLVGGVSGFLPGLHHTSGGTNRTGGKKSKLERLAGSPGVGAQKV